MNIMSHSNYELMNDHFPFDGMKNKRDQFSFLEAYNNDEPDGAEFIVDNTSDNTNANEDLNPNMNGGVDASDDNNVEGSTGEDSLKELDNQNLDNVEPDSKKEGDLFTEISLTDEQDFHNPVGNETSFNGGDETSSTLKLNTSGKNIRISNATKLDNGETSNGDSFASGFTIENGSNVENKQNVSKGGSIISGFKGYIKKLFKPRASKSLPKEKEEDFYAGEKRKIYTGPMKTTNVNPYSKLVYYTKDFVPNKSRINSLVEEEELEWKYTILKQCSKTEIEVADKDDIHRMLIKYVNQYRNISKSVDIYNNCLADTFPQGKYLYDQLTPKGAAIGSLNVLNVPVSSIKDDVILMRGLDFASFHQVYFSYNTDNKRENLERLNYCIINPKKLSQLFDTSRIRLESAGYMFDIFKKDAMLKSIKCHIDAFHMNGFKSSNKKCDILDELHKRTKVFRASFSTEGNKMIDAVLFKFFNYYQSSYDMAKFYVENKDRLMQYILHDSLERSCVLFQKSDNYLDALVSVYQELQSTVNTLGNCIHNLTLYHDLVQDIKKFWRIVLTFVLRRGVLSNFHFDMLLSTYAKNRKLSKSELPVKPVEEKYKNSSVYVMALFAVRRLSILQLVHDFFEAKKKELSVIITMAKIDLIHLAKEHIFEDSKKKLKYEKIKKIIKTYKQKLKTMFDNMRKQYLALLKIRLQDVSTRDYTWFPDLI